MFKLFVDWYRRRFSDPNVVSLVIFILALFLIIYFFNRVLLTTIIAIVFAYMLDSTVTFLTRHGLNRTLAVSVVLFAFCSVVLLAVVILLPLIWQQGITLFKNIPMMLNFLNNALAKIPEHYPELIDVGLFDSLIQNVRESVISTGNTLVQISIASLFNALTIIVNSVVIPIMMFFLLKDKQKIWSYCLKFLPRDRKALTAVAIEMDQQISNYVVGSVLHIIILFVMLYIPFWFLGLDYGLLLAFIVSLSVIVPYIGLIVSSIPVILIALFQWGLSTEFTLFTITYVVIQTLDGNITSPILYSEKLNLHPLVVILAVIIFGGLWGFWGVFFALPLATLIKAVINAWPNFNNELEKN
ncbi:AI-2E family transporter [Orbaceae bacterium ac157xtp]